MAAKGGAEEVTIVTPDRHLGRELGGTNLGAHLTELYELGVRVKTDTKLVALSRTGGGIETVTRNIYSGAKGPLTVDQVIADAGTLPNDDVYVALKPLSANLGEVDLRRLVAMEPQDLVRNPGGRFRLYRIGDAWTSRNLHAAMLDAARVGHLI